MMCEVNRNYDAAMAHYRDQLSSRFPSATVQVMPEGIGGSDAWIDLRVPEERLIEALDYVAGLETEILDRFDVDIVTTTFELHDEAAA
jgi:hypothetical protein